MNEPQVIQILISSAAGLFGVGVGVGLFRGSVKQMQKDLERIQYKQIKLRGEDNGGLPLYITRSTCSTMREDCERLSSKTIDKLKDDLKDHTKIIRSLENFARWWMLKEGLHIDEVNRILLRE